MMVFITFLILGVVLPFLIWGLPLIKKRIETKDEEHTVEVDQEQSKNEPKQRTFNDIFDSFSKTGELSLVDSYFLFGASQDTPILDIKRKYHEMLLKFHPDVNSSTFAQNSVVMINMAWELIRKHENDLDS